MKFVFFSLRDFKREGGGTIRMYGLINALALKGHEVTFIGNARPSERIHESVNLVPLGVEFTKKEKSIIQGLCAALPTGLASILFKKKINAISQILKSEQYADKHIIFFEYLDNTIGYILKKLGIIKRYINDIHGVVTVEFEFEYKNAKTITGKGLGWLKYHLADKLDHKVFSNADGLIYVSEAMKEYYFKKYPLVKNVEYTILPNLINSNRPVKNYDETAVQALKEKLQISDRDFVFFFAGGFKRTSGISNTLEALRLLKQKYPRQSFKYLLIGKGPIDSQIKKKISQARLDSVVIQIPCVSYDQLELYQQLANVIVNSDIDNSYSQMIVHLKYFDALVSGRLVINGNFKSVQELNEAKKLSLLYDPSSFESFYLTMENSYINYDILRMSFLDSQKYVLKNLSYQTQIEKIAVFTQQKN